MARRRWNWKATRDGEDGVVAPDGIFVSHDDLEVWVNHKYDGDGCSDLPTCGVCKTRVRKNWRDVLAWLVRGDHG